MKQLLGVLLSLVLITSNNMLIKNISAMEQSDTKEVIKELKDQRTVNSNTYLLKDGSVKKEIFLDNIRYEEDGKLKEYNNELREVNNKEKDTIKNIFDSDYKYTNKSSDVDNYFPDKLSGTEDILTTYDKYMVSMKPMIANKEDSQDGVVKGGQITYQSDDIEYQYISMNNGIKENIVINKKPKETSFKFELNLKNLMIKQTDGNRGLSVVDEKTKKQLGFFEVPYIKDATGAVNYEDVRYEIMDGTKPKVIIDVDESYFDENVNYPVIIDPTMVWQFGYISATGVWSASSMQNSSLHTNPLYVSNNINDSSPYAGTEHRIFVDTSNLTTGNALYGNGLSFDGEIIESATLQFYEGTIPYYYPSGGTVQIKRALSSWSSSTITWNNQPSLYSTPIAQVTCTGVLDDSHSIDITSWVQGLANGNYDNYGLAFTCPNAYSSAAIYTPDVNYIYDQNGHYIGVRHMSITVVYRPYNEIVHKNYVSGTKTYSLFNDYDNLPAVEYGYDVDNNNRGENQGERETGLSGVRSIVPGGSLTPVTSIVYPYKPIVALVESSSGNYYNNGTGYVIGPNTILTAAHCLKDSTFYVTTMIGSNSTTTFSVTDAYYQSLYEYYPNGSEYADLKKQYDWAVLTVDGNIGEITGWLGFINGTIGITNVEVAGYCTYPQSGYIFSRLYKDSGLTANEGTYNIEYGLSTWPGQSGSPIIDSNNFARGVHISATDNENYNRGRKFDGFMFAFAKEKKEEGVELYEED